MSKNSTSRGNNNRSSYWPCARPYTEFVPREVWIGNGILNTAFALPTIVFNLLIIVVLLRGPSFRKPPFIIFIALSLSDMCVGLIGNPAYACLNIAVLLEDAVVFCIAKRIGGISIVLFTCTSLMTTTLASTERYLAVVLNLRYEEKLTKKRTVAAIVGVWLVAGTLVVLFKVLHPVDKVWSVVTITMIGICVLVTSLAYRRIHQEVKSQAVAINSQNVLLGGRGSISRASCAKINRCVLSVFLVFILCYMPMVCIWGMRLAYGGWTKTMLRAFEFANTLVFFKSMLNPIVYCWRLKAIRVEVRKLFMGPFFKTRNNNESMDENFISLRESRVWIPR